MAVSKTDICNMALSHLGLSQYISNVDSDNTVEALVCRKWYDPALQYVQREHDWNFTRVYVTLAELTGTKPRSWQYKYGYPANALVIRHIVPPGVRNPRVEERLQYEVATEKDAANNYIRVIYCDQYQAEACFSRLVEDPGLFDIQFSFALSYWLATLIGMPLTVKPMLIDAAQKAYHAGKFTAWALNMNEAEEGPEPETETMAVRNG